MTPNPNRIIKTRIRDIERSEAARCIKSEYLAVNDSGIWDRDFRGQEVAILTPPIDGDNHWACEGPFYQQLDKPYGLCIHWLEIGD